MLDETRLSKSEIIEFEDLQSDWFSLRIGETIPRLEIAKIKKVTGNATLDNLPGTDYKYIIEATDGKALVVNSWSLWRKIRASLRSAGRIRVALELKHDGVEDYTVRVIDIIG